MRTLSINLHQHETGHYRLRVTIWEDGQPPVHLIEEESNPQPELGFRETWEPVQQMVADALAARFPDLSLWAQARG